MLPLRTPLLGLSHLWHGTKAQSHREIYRVLAQACGGTVHNTETNKINSSKKLLSDFF